MEEDDETCGVCGIDINERQYCHVCGDNFMTWCNGCEKCKNCGNLDDSCVSYEYLNYQIL